MQMILQRQRTLSEPSKALLTQARQFDSRKTNKNLALSLNFSIEKSSNNPSLQGFIKSRFAQVYQASITQFMPQFIVAKSNEIQALMGFQYATQALLLEQYLSKPIEHYLNLPSCNRKQIIEIGNLAGINHQAIALFLVSSLSFYFSNFRYLCFCATEKVQHMLKHCGVKLQLICEAKQNRLKLSSDHWGTYYKNAPSVCALDLSSIVSVVKKSPQLSALFKQHKHSIKKLSQQLTQGQGE